MLDDMRRASLSVGRGDDGRWLLKCHAGCAFPNIVRALGVDARDLFPSNSNGRRRPQRREVAVYDYDGVFEVVRYEPKDFRQRRPDGRGGHLWNLDGVTPRLYRLNDVAGREQAIIAEGEKDIDRLWSLDLAAMCNAGGAGQWRPGHTGQLKAAGVRRVVMVPDADEAGRTHGQSVARACVGAGLGVRIVAGQQAGVRRVGALVPGDDRQGRHRGIPEVEFHLAGDLTGHALGHAVEHQLFRPVVHRSPRRCSSHGHDCRVPVAICDELCYSPAGAARLRGNGRVCRSRGRPCGPSPPGTRRWP